MKAQKKQSQMTSPEEVEIPAAPTTTTRKSHKKLITFLCVICLIIGGLTIAGAVMAQPVVPDSLAQEMKEDIVKDAVWDVEEGGEIIVVTADWTLSYEDLTEDDVNNILYVSTECDAILDEISATTEGTQVVKCAAGLCSEINGNMLTVEINGVLFEVVNTASYQLGDMVDIVVLLNA